MTKRLLGNGAVTYYTYDAVGQTTKVDNRTSGLTAIASCEYERDAVGNPESIVREDGDTTYYEYDAKHQLIGELQRDDQGQDVYAWAWDYDAAGNRTYQTFNGVTTYYSYNAANELLTETTDAETTYYHYDGCGNTVAKQETAGTTYYAYDTENLLTRIDFAAGGHNYYTYDADSKRVSQQTADGFREFIYQGPDMLALQMERDESETTVAQYTMGDGLEAMRRSGTSSFYHYNHLGTTLALTGANEAVTDTYQHDAWGVLLGSTGATVNPHTYVGQQRYYRMPTADLYHLGFRDYAQGLGRFATVDPLLNLIQPGMRPLNGGLLHLPRDVSLSLLMQLTPVASIASRAALQNQCTFQSTPSQTLFEGVELSQLLKLATKSIYIYQGGRPTVGSDAIGLVQTCETKYRCDPTEINLREATWLTYQWACLIPSFALCGLLGGALCEAVCLLIAPEMAPVCTIICIFVGIGIGALCSAGCNWAADQLTGCRPMMYKDLWPAVKEI